MATTDMEKSFLVGETVHLRSRVAEPGTKKPVDPASVTLTSWRKGTEEILNSPIAFSREGQGEYALTLETVGMEPGTYHVTVMHSDGPERIAAATDTFVLQSA